MRRLAYAPREKTVEKFTSSFRKRCVKEGLTIDVFEQAKMWDLMEKRLGEMLREFIRKSPIV